METVPICLIGAWPEAPFQSPLFNTSNLATEGTVTQATGTIAVCALQGSLSVRGWVRGLHCCAQTHPHAPRDPVVIRRHLPSAPRVPRVSAGPPETLTCFAGISSLWMLQIGLHLHFRMMRSAHQIFSQLFPFLKGRYLNSFHPRMEPMTPRCLLGTGDGSHETVARGLGDEQKAWLPNEWE